MKSGACTREMAKWAFKKIYSEYFIQEILEKHVLVWSGFQKDSPK
jgi:hypothetical protein